MLGTFLGAVLVTLLTNGLLLLRIGEFWVQACLGVVLLFAVLIDKARRTYLAHLNGRLRWPETPSADTARPSSAGGRAWDRIARADWFGPFAVTLAAVVA